MRKPLLRLLAICFSMLAWAIPARSEATPRHRLKAGIVVDSYTDFGSYGTIQTGGIVEYGYSLYVRRISEQQDRYFDVSTGIRTGITFESLRSFTVAFQPRVFPITIPVMFLARSGINIFRWARISGFLDGGANIIFYKNIYPYFLFSFSGGLVVEVYFLRTFGIGLDLGWGMWGRDNDFWYGPVARAGLVVKL